MNLFKKSLALGVVFLAGAGFAKVEIKNLRCEYLTDPLGIDAASPRLSWIITSAQRGEKQTAYQILVARSEAQLRAGQGDLWDSGKIASDQTAQVLYAGKKLASGQRAWWTVRAWDAAGQPSESSAPAWWEMGLLAPADWHGKWIGRADLAGLAANQAPATPELRRAFTLEGKIKRARACVIGLGYFELSINGHRIGDHLLDPGYTRYDRRLLYVTHDVTPALQAGDNVIGVMLGNGWFNVSTKAAWDFDQAPWRATPRLLLELRVEMEDGRLVTISSDEQWKTSDSPITFSSIYGGENYDARLEQPGWDAPGFRDDSWQQALVLDAPKGQIVAQAMHPIRITKVIQPAALTEPEPGVFVFDAGQNLTGNAELNLSGPAGCKVTLRYGEKLDAKGRVDQSNIAVHVWRFDRNQQFQTDNYTLKGQGSERWRSRFNYNGFRYVEITGAPGRLATGNLAINFFHSDVPEAGNFETSNPLLNRIWVNGRWSYLGNLFGIPTDCPHREKNGWTGDAEVASEQGLFYQDGITVYEKWIRDLADEQRSNGALPGIAPTGGWGYGFGGPPWDSALLIVPWHLYEYYGDSAALKQNYEAGKRYVEYLTTRARGGLVNIGLKDWSPWKANTSPAVTDTGYYYRDARILAAVARLLGKEDDAKKHDALADDIRAAFNKAFFNAETGSYGTGTQTALGCALYQGLAGPENESRVVDNLVAAIARADNHLDFGYLGAQYVPNALAAHGRADVAYAMLTQTTPPGYGWQIAQGATTLWETWDGTGSQSGSLNHTFFGDVNAWMMKTIAGINPDPAAPGFKRILINPHVLGDLAFAKGSYDSVHGLIASEWTLQDGQFRLSLTIPANCAATVSLPIADPAQVREGDAPVNRAPGVAWLRAAGKRSLFTVESGAYHFSGPFSDETGSARQNMDNARP
ncbi:MAG: glycoside hydrolase family 78 protein [Verrucomicrobiota bacterium]